MTQRKNVMQNPILRYDNVLLDSIERERNGVDFFCSGHDKIVFKKMIEEINTFCGTDFHYLAEINAFYIPGSGAIMAHYLDRFQSESIRGYLIPQIVSDRVSECERIVLSAYLHFKNSDAYISPPSKPAPAQIITRYDHAFKALKPKRLKGDLLSLACNPRDAFYLPFTMRMLASWKIPVLEGVYTTYLDGASITNQSVGLPVHAEAYYPPLPFIRRELKLTALHSLKYYPSENTIKLIKKCMHDPDKDIASAADKTFRFWEKHTLLKCTEDGSVL